jgi:hypothetical protein
MGMGRPRRDVIREDSVGVYHVWNRTVRATYLCGIDPWTGLDYRHRKKWMLDRIEELANIFAIDTCVAAVLSNHFHLILRNRPDLVKQWSNEEVVRRWWMLFPERRDENGRPAEPTDLEIASLATDRYRVEMLRKRLSSISWMMKCLDESIAKRINREDNKKGHVWQDRFGCRNLVDEGAILACAIYIDLNEIRAQIALTPEESLHTSAHLRILGRWIREDRAGQQGIHGVSLVDSVLNTCDYQPDDPDYWLCPINESDRAPLLGATSNDATGSQDIASFDDATVTKRWRHGFLPLTLDEYLQVLDSSGRQIVAGKSGAIDDTLPPILKRLGIQPEQWLEMMEHFERWFHGSAGRAETVMQKAHEAGRRWRHGISHCRTGFA